MPDKARQLAGTPAGPDGKKPGGQYAHSERAQRVIKIVAARSGLEGYDADAWIDMGFSDDEAVLWWESFKYLSAAVEWRDAGFSLTEAYGWRESFSVKDAKAWKDAGVNSPNEVEMWRELHIKTPELVKPLIENGFYPIKALVPQIQLAHFKPKDRSQENQATPTDS